MGPPNRNPKQKLAEKLKDKMSETAKPRVRPKRLTTKKPLTSGQKGNSSKVKEATTSSAGSLNGECSYSVGTRTPSILNYLNRVAMGIPVDTKIKQVKKSIIMNQLDRFDVVTCLSPFTRRVTSIAWHPQFNEVLVAGSKGGDLVHCSVSDPRKYILIPGMGPGGTITGLKCDYDHPNIAYTSSIIGTIRRVDFNTKDSKTYASTGIFQNWFTALDVCYTRKLILSGDCFGNADLMSLDGKKLWCKRLHKKKISHIEFSSNENVFVTASVDRSVQLWDVRMIDEMKNKKYMPTHEFLYDKPVNSAFFSPSNGHSLLTTDQQNEIRIFKSPNWDVEMVIQHPHRQYHHLTPIKAAWHPMEDIVVVGRYPDEKFKLSDKRTIDFYDGETGHLLHQKSSTNGGIIALNAFNISGDCMVSTTSGSLFIWKDTNLFDV